MEMDVWERGRMSKWRAPMLCYALHFTYFILCNPVFISPRRWVAMWTFLQMKREVIFSSSQAVMLEVCSISYILLSAFC